MYNKDDLIVILEPLEIDANIDDRIGIGGGGTGRGGLKWNFIASTTVPTNATPGVMGDIIVITDDDDLVKKLKYIANRNPNSTDFIDNSITFYYDSGATRIVVNEISHFQCILQAKTQNVIIDGISYGLNVYCYDGYTHTWVPFGVAYRDNINIIQFSGKDLDIDTIFNSVFDTLEESIVTDKRTPVISQVSDLIDISQFNGSIELITNFDTILPATIFGSISESVTANGNPIS